MDRRWLGRLSLVALAAVAGCGRGGPRVAGVVTRGGAPVAAGAITFNPDLDNGNNGPRATLLIRDGKFDSDADTGPPISPGPHLVRVSVPPAVAADPDDAQAEDHRFTATVPAAGAVDLSFDIGTKAGGP